MKKYTREDYNRDHIENVYVNYPLAYENWVRKMKELDRLTARINRLLASPDWNENQYWALEKKCSVLCGILGF